MSVIKSKLSIRSEEFKANATAMSLLVADLREKTIAVSGGGSPETAAKHKARGKLLPRERINALLDPGASFLEFSALAAYGMYSAKSPTEVASAGVVTGIGRVKGVECMIVANDATVKGGSYFPLTVKKHLRAQEIALQNRLPCIYLVDSGGANLPTQDEVFPDRDHFGRIFYNQANMSALGIPQIGIVMGSCTAGGAYMPAMSDESVIVKNQGTIFLGGPPLVKAATGEVVSAEALGGAEMHTSVSGTCDYAADDEPHAMAIARDIFAQTSPVTKQTIDRIAPEAPYYDPKELYGIIPTDWKTGFDIREVIARIVDGSHFHEYQPNYGTTLVCGYARIWGCKVGILGNNGVLFNDSSLKAAHFMQLCDRDRTPLVFLQNITGYMVGREYEERGITKDGAKMIMSQVGCSVPKFTVIVGGSFGAGNYGMCGRAFDGRFLWMWPQSQIAVMGAEQAANTLADVKIRQLQRQGQVLGEEDIAAIRQPVLESFQSESDAYYSSSELWDDGILDPVDTRNALGIAIVASLNAPFGEQGYGVMRF